MKKETINLQWIEKEKRYEKEISRQDIIDIMKSLKNGFDENNEISKKLCEILPNTVSITLNKDRNEQLDIPMISLKVGENTYVLEIRRNHKIIWGILNEYCKEKIE